MGFLYVKVPVGDGDAADSHHRLHEALEQALAEAGLGTLLGWGDSLGEPGERGQRPLRWHRVDVEVGDVGAARALLRRVLDASGTAIGAELHYTAARAPCVDLRGEDGWETLPRPR